MAQPRALTLSPASDGDRFSPISDSDSLAEYIPATLSYLATNVQTAPAPTWRTRDVSIHTVADESDDESDVKPPIDGGVKPQTGHPTHKRKASTVSLSPFNSEDEAMLDAVLESSRPTTPKRPSPSGQSYFPTPSSTSSPCGPSTSCSNRPTQTARNTPVKRAKISSPKPHLTPAPSHGKKQGPFSSEEDLEIFRHLLSGAPTSALAPKLNRLSNAVATRSKRIIRDCEALLGKKHK